MNLPNNLKVEENAWAMGCEQCSYGFSYAPPLTNKLEVYMQRMVQMIDEELEFCTCKAGTRYRAHLLNVRQRFLEEARKDHRMAEYAKRQSHPEIERARRLLRDATPEPTIHYEGVTA